MTLPRLEVVARRRPIDVVAPLTARRADGDTWAMPQPAPYAAVLGEVGTGRAALTLRSGDDTVTGWWDGERCGLDVTDARGRSSRHVSRRKGRPEGPVDRLALTLSGTQVTVLAHEAHPRGPRWQARARFTLADRIDSRDEDWLAALSGSAAGTEDVQHGELGQVGLRDLRVVTTAEGEPVRDDGLVLLTATHAGPGFFDTAHTGVWALDPEALTLTHRGTLFFRRADRPGVYGDNATHLVRDGDEWLVATSTWGSFDRAHKDARVEVVLARSAADLTRGTHVLDTSLLALPTDGFRSVGVWDPHLLRVGDQWRVAYVSARKFFAFHPVVATGPSLDDLTLRAASTDRRATEGVTWHHDGLDWRILASDGRDSARRLRGRYPVLDLDLREVGTLDAPYPTNLPWPTLVPYDDGWLMVAFNGRPALGPLAGYGTHGDVVLMRSRSSEA